MNSIDRFVKQAEQLFLNRKRMVHMIQAVAAIVIITVVSLVKSVYGKGAVEANIQQEIASQIIRFHVIANSDSDRDQQLKLKVKEQVVSYMQQKLAACENREQAKNVLLQESEEVEALACRILRENGCNDGVRVELSNVYFPIKVYGDLTFPEGYYDAYRILIGNAQGKNWWCVMFPSLCLVNETYSVVPDDSKDKLKNVLTEEEYDTIDTSNEPINADASGDLIEQEDQEQEEPTEVNAQYHFWIVDALSDLF